MNTMWEIYDRLLAEIPAGLVVDKVNVALNWTQVMASGRFGLSLTVKSRRRSKVLADSLRGMDLRDLAALAKSWNFTEAAIGVAAINAWFNDWGLVSALPGLEPQPMGQSREDRKAKDAFDSFAEALTGKKVAVIGGFPKLAEKLAPVSQLIVLERDPNGEDYPDSACEYLLAEQDFVFITGTTLINKTLPRLLQICAGTKVALVGPSVPLCPVFFDYGVDNLSGFVPTDFDNLDDILGRARKADVFLAGRMVSVNRA